jgi:hypothetical protein
MINRQALPCDLSNFPYIPRFPHQSPLSGWTTHFPIWCRAMGICRFRDVSERQIVPIYDELLVKQPDHAQEARRIRPAQRGERRMIKTPAAQIEPDAVKQRGYRASLSQSNRRLGR